MRICVLVLTSLLLALPASGAEPAYPEVWDTTFEGNPASGDSVEFGDDHIRQLKQEIGQRLKVEHEFDNTQSADNGLHRQGSARCFVMNVAPTHLGDEDSADQRSAGPVLVHNPLLGGDTGTDSLSAVPTVEESTSAFDKVGYGRCWIDLNGDDNIAGTVDDLRLHIYTDSGWEPVGASRLEEPSHSAYNLLYNGSFNAVGLYTNTAIPNGWTLEGSGNAYAYAAIVDDIDGAGVELRMTSDAQNDGLKQTLANLKDDALYQVVVRVRADGSATCLVDTTNAAVQASVVTTGTTIITLTDTFVTNSTVTAVEVMLTQSASANSGVNTCDWISAAVYEVEHDADPPTWTKAEAVPSPGVIIDTDITTDQADTSMVVAPGTVIASTDLTVPVPGGYITSYANVSLSAGGSGNSQCYAFIEFDINGAATWADCNSGRVGNVTGIAAATEGTVTLQCIATNPVAGDRYQYRLSVVEDGSGAVCDYGQGEDIQLHTIWHPSR